MVSADLVLLFSVQGAYDVIEYSGLALDADAL
jgi:hypothetical protein